MGAPPSGWLVQLMENRSYHYWVEAAHLELLIGDVAYESFFSCEVNILALYHDLTTAFYGRHPISFYRLHATRYNMGKCACNSTKALIECWFRKKSSPLWLIEKKAEFLAFFWTLKNGRFFEEQLLTLQLNKWTAYPSGRTRCRRSWRWSRGCPGCPRSWGRICGHGEQSRGSRSLFSQSGSR